MIKFFNSKDWEYGFFSEVLVLEFGGIKFELYYICKFILV